MIKIKREHTKIRNDFPIFEKHPKLIYFDNGATTQKPKQVLDVVNEYYQTANANPHRGSYQISVESTKQYEESKKIVANFIGAKNEKQIIYTKNATEAINLIAYTYGIDEVKETDKVVISILEHHSNIVPWQYVTKQKNATLEYMYIDTETLELPEQEILNKIDNKTKIVAITHLSNVLGIVNPIEKIIQRAHEVGAVVVLDCAQSVPHMKLDMTKLDVDFAIFSGHKMLAPFGIGVLYAKEELLNQMNPFLFGGDMIEYVYEQDTTFDHIPTKFEAGTQNVAGAVGLAEAITYINTIGMDTINQIEHELVTYAKNKMRQLDYVTIYEGKEHDKNTTIGIIPFNIKGVHPHDVASILDSYGIAIRAGDHCAQPLHRYLGLSATCRASFYLYNTREEIDQFMIAIEQVYKMFNQWKKEK